MSTSLLGLELESESVMKSKAIKFIVKKLSADYKWQWKPIRSVVKKYAANENSNGRKTRQNRLMLLPNCAVYGKIDFYKKNIFPILIILKLIIYAKIAFETAFYWTSWKNSNI